MTELALGNELFGMQVRAEYVSTMREVYSGIFRAHCRHMSRSCIDSVAPSDTLVPDQASMGTHTSALLKNSAFLLSSPLSVRYAPLSYLCMRP